MKPLTPLSKTLVFFSGIILLSIALGILARNSGAVYNQGVFLVIHEKRKWAKERHMFDPQKKSVIFLGNSVQLAALKPQDFDNATQQKTQSFNFSLPALPIGPGLFVLQSLCQSWGKPDYIVVRIVTDNSRIPGLFDTNAVQGIGGREFFSYLFRRSNKAFALNGIFPLRMNIGGTLKYLKNLVLDPEDIHRTYSENRSILDQLRADRGWYYIEQQAIFPDGRLPDDYALVDPKHLTPLVPDPFEWSPDAYFKQFLDYTAEQGIKILLISSVYREGTAAPWASQPPEFIEIPKHYPHVYVSKHSWERKFLPNRFWSDKTHLNPEGARLYSQMIAADFMDAFGGEF
ncbi:MAG: hypothetical protein KCHDKBKB_00929 [Elusimicrobia bacterium]|nr:hypothetical protein [Elusimicrobiota bacterium]